MQKFLNINCSTNTLAISNFLTNIFKIYIVSSRFLSLPSLFLHLDSDSIIKYILVLKFADTLYYASLILMVHNKYIDMFHNCNYLLPLDYGI